MIKINRYNRTHADRVDEIKREIEIKANRGELTESEMLAGMNFGETQRRVEKTNEMEAEINGIENELTLIRLSQMNIEYRLKRLKISAKKNE